MQVKNKEKLSSGSSVKALEKIIYDLETLGYCSEQTKKQIIDEEKTHAAEVLASVCYETDIPRNYFIKANDIVDGHGVSLSNVLDKGVEHIENDYNKKPGKNWELRRRKIEKQNLESIIYMPEGVVCVEISSTDISKPETELKEWGYSGSTLLRITYKEDAQNVVQRNIMLDFSDMKILNMLRKKVDTTSEDLKTSEEILASPLFISVKNDNFEAFVSDLKNFAKNQEASSKPHLYLLNIIKKSKTAKNNSWDFVKENLIFEEMFNEIQKLAESKNLSEHDINIIRIGTWQVLMDQARNITNCTELTIDDGKAKARAIGAVFTSCGGTVSVEISSQHTTSGYFDRYFTATALINRICKLGFCRACGVNSFMYGCGVYCKNCNATWCNEYIYSGKQLSDNEVLQKRYLFFFWR